MNSAIDFEFSEYIFLEYDNLQLMSSHIDLSFFQSL